MEKINVLHIYKFYLPHIGGIERTIQLIAENLKDKKIEARILTCSHYRTLKTTKEVVDAIEVTRTNSLGILFSTPLSISFFKNFRLLSQRSDILHIHSPFPLAEMSYLLFRPKGSKLVISIHSDISQTRWACFAPYYKYLLNEFLKRADRIITTSPAMLESSPMLHPFVNKCQVIPLAIDLNKLCHVSPERKRDLRDYLGIGNDKVILFVGRLNYQKGVEYLINAMQKIDARLIIIGSGELREYLQEESEKLSLQNKIHFAGIISDKDLPAYYSIADVFVLPSITSGETFGLVQLEAMAYGVPIVNTDLPTGITFVSPHNVTGLTVPPCDSIALANAVNRILQDDELRKHFSDNGLLRVKHFSLDKMLNEICQVYEDLIKPT